MSIPTPEVEAEKEEFETVLSFQNGKECKITFEFPKDEAIVAIHAIRMLGSTKGITQMFAALEDDPSVRDRLENAGLSFGGDGDEDDDL